MELNDLIEMFGLRSRQMKLTLIVFEELRQMMSITDYSEKA